MSRSSDASKHAVWRARFERFFDSELPVARFCAREGVSVASFYLWRKKLGAKGRRPSALPFGQKEQRGRRRVTAGPRCATAGPGRDGTGSVDGRGVFQQVEVLPTGRATIGAAPAAVSAGGRFKPAAWGVMSAAPAVSIQLPCGTRIEVAGEDVDALRAVVAEVVRAGRVTTMPAEADRNREAGAA